MRDSAAYVELVGHPNFGTMYDTFHGHLEEKSQTRAIAAHAPFIRHIHVSENDRGAPGSGQIDFPRILTELKRHNYDRWLVIEAFSPVPELAGATHVWRDLSSAEEVCRSGAWIRQLWHNA
jgi:D-psicose/D-tagatose/L-ribulose 3-epimerase